MKYPRLDSLSLHPHSQSGGAVTAIVSIDVLTDFAAVRAAGFLSSREFSSSRRHQRIQSAKSHDSGSCTSRHRYPVRRLRDISQPSNPVANTPRYVPLAAAALGQSERKNRSSAAVAYYSIHESCSRKTTGLTASRAALALTASNKKSLISSFSPWPHLSSCQARRFHSRCLRAQHCCQLIAIVALFFFFSLSPFTFLLVSHKILLAWTRHVTLGPPSRFIPRRPKLQPKQPSPSAPQTVFFSLQQHLPLRSCFFSLSTYFFFPPFFSRSIVFVCGLASFHFGLADDIFPALPVILLHTP